MGRWRGRVLGAAGRAWCGLREGGQDGGLGGGGGNEAEAVEGLETVLREIVQAAREGEGGQVSCWMLCFARVSEGSRLVAVGLALTLNRGLCVAAGRRRTTPRPGPGLVSGAREPPGDRSAGCCSLVLFFATAPPPQPPFVGSHLALSPRPSAHDPT